MGDGDPARLAAALFEEQRPRLRGLAYRMTGSLNDADDIVQESWARLQQFGAGHIDSPAAWLTTVVTRLSIDRVRQRARRKETYRGPWLPEPLVTSPGPEQLTELSESLTLAFLTLLDELTPVERAVIVLADVFAVPFPEIATTVVRSPEACRQIASRARHRLRAADPTVAPGGRNPVVQRMVDALVAGDLTSLVGLLAPDVTYISDAGSDRPAARRPIVGPVRVGRVLLSLSKRLVAGGFTVDPAVVNGAPGFLFRVDGVPDTVVSFDICGDRVAAVWVMRNPVKLLHAENAGPIV